MTGRTSSQSLRVGLAGGKAWIATRTFDGVETDVSYNLEAMDVDEVRFVLAELGKLLPEMEEAERAEKAKRRDELLKRKREIESELRSIESAIASLPSSKKAKAAEQAYACPECGQADCDGEGVGHYRG